MFQYIFSVFVRLIVVFTALPVHEFAHAFIADKLGDKTARFQGRLTLNPFSHFDIIGTVALLLTGFGWAKPVPVNPYNFSGTKVGIKGGMAITALAGPVSNLLMALCAMIIAKSVILIPLPYQFLQVLVMALSLIVQTNIGLAVFNLIPIPPLDGSKVMAAVLPNRAYNIYMSYERYAYIALIVVLVTGILDRPIMYVQSWIYWFFNLITGFIG